MSDKALFFATMRKPEMRVIRAALYDLKWEHDIDWKNITSLEISEPISHNGRFYGPWMLITDRHVSVCYDFEDAEPSDFTVLALNEPEPDCQCTCCQAMREAQLQEVTQ